MGELVNKRASSLGGLHVNIAAGERFTISKGEDEIIIQMNGKKGTNQYSMSVKAPKSFYIKMPKREINVPE